MLFNTLATSALLLAAAHASAEPAPYKLGKMSMNNAFGLLKRQAGYQPSQTYCGPGETCADSCGAGYVQCPSTDGDMHCFDPDVKQTCCPDGTGNSCDDGYYCTSDATGGTWCCPDGMDLAACAAAYSLTGSLVSETAAPTSSLAPASTYSPASVSASVSKYSTSIPIYYTPSTTSSAKVVATSTSAAATYVTAMYNGTVASTTSSLPLQVTGAANAKVVPGLMIMAGAMLAL